MSQSDTESATIPAPQCISAPPPGRVPCWLCDRDIAVRRSRDGHCYVVCLDCGMQAFIRSMAGERRLEELKETSTK